MVTSSWRRALVRRRVFFLRYSGALRGGGPRVAYVVFIAEAAARRALRSSASLRR